MFKKLTDFNKYFSVLYAFGDAGPEVFWKNHETFSELLKVSLFKHNIMIKNFSVIGSVMS